MSEDNTCPVEGCDYPADGEATESGLRSHINAMTDDDHDWKRLKSVVEGESEPDEPESDPEANPEGGDEGGESGGSPAPADDEPEPAREQAESDETSENEATDPMPTDDEYQRQQDRGGSDSGSTDDSSGSTGDGGSPLAALPVDPVTLMMLVGVAVLAYLTYRALTSSSESTAPAPEPDEDDGPADTGGEEVSGGLVG